MTDHPTTGETTEPARPSELRRGDQVWHRDRQMVVTVIGVFPHATTWHGGKRVSATAIDWEGEDGQSGVLMHVDGDAPLRRVKSGG